MLELTQFLGAVMGQNAIAVTGAEGRDALEAALRIESAIEAAQAGLLARGAAEVPGEAGAARA